MRALKKFAEALWRSKKDQETVDELWRGVREDDAVTGRVVQEVLLPSLGDDLANLQAISPELSPLKLFVALDVISMLVHRVVTQIAPEVTEVVLSSEGQVSTDGQVLQEKEVVILEISHVAKLDVGTAEKLLASWIPRAASQQPLLFPGLECKPSGNGDLLMKLTQRRIEEDLSVRWS